MARLYVYFRRKELLPLPPLLHRLQGYRITRESAGRGKRSLAPRADISARRAVFARKTKGTIIGSSSTTLAHLHIRTHYTQDAEHHPIEARGGSRFSVPEVVYPRGRQRAARAQKPPLSRGEVLFHLRGPLCLGILGSRARSRAEERHTLEVSSARAVRAR